MSQKGVGRVSRIEALSSGHKGYSCISISQFRDNHFFFVYAMHVNRILPISMSHLSVIGQNTFVSPGVLKLQVVYLN